VGNTESIDESMRADPLIAEPVPRARARDGIAFRTIAKEAINGKGSFNFHHKTKRGRRTDADRCPDDIGGGG
jgi:hypothetical protein